MKIHLAVIVALTLLAAQVSTCSSKTIETPKPIVVDTKVAPTTTPKTPTPKAVKKSPVKIEKVTLSEFETQLIDLINTERVTQGLSKLKVVDQLNQAALYKAKDMKEKDYFAHDSESGESITKFIWKTGYIVVWAGENLARGFSTPNEVMQGWMNSPKHKAIMLSPKYNEVGLSRHGDLTVLVVVQK